MLLHVQRQVINVENLLELLLEFDCKFLDYKNLFVRYLEYFQVL